MLDFGDHGDVDVPEPGEDVWFVRWVDQCCWGWEEVQVGERFWMLYGRGGFSGFVVFVGLGSRSGGIGWRFSKIDSVRSEISRGLASNS